MIAGVRAQKKVITDVLRCDQIHQGCTGGNLKTSEVVAITQGVLACMRDDPKATAKSAVASIAKSNGITFRRLKNYMDG